MKYKLLFQKFQRSLALVLINLLISKMGNGIAKIEGKKNGGNSFMAMALPKQEEKKLLQLVCGNGITKIEGKKKKKSWQLICGC